jgi:hypothetical protein
VRGENALESYFATQTRSTVAGCPEFTSGAALPSIPDVIATLTTHYKSTPGNDKQIFLYFAGESCLLRILYIKLPQNDCQGIAKGRVDALAYNILTLEAVRRVLMH